MDEDTAANFPGLNTNKQACETNLLNFLLCVRVFNSATHGTLTIVVEKPLITRNIEHFASCGALCFAF